MGTSTKSVARPVTVSVSNVGGIDRTEVDLSPGVTVLSGRNATNRTSLLRALMAAVGSEDASLKADADEGSVELQVGDETYTRTLRREDGAVVTDGRPYLDDPELADLFAFLLESNEARRAVARGDDLRELIMRPVDTAAIRAEIERLKAERRTIEERLEEIDGRRERLPNLERERADLTDRIEGKREDLADLETKIESLDADLDESREGNEELEAKLAALRERRSDLEEVRFKVDTNARSLEALRDRHAELETDLGDTPEAPDRRAASLDDEIERLRSELRDLESSLNELGTVIQFNEEMLDGTSREVAAALQGDDGAVTDGLLDRSEVVCWTCGTAVAAERIEATLDRLRSLRREKSSRRRSVKEEISEREAERSALEEQQERRRRLEGEVAEVEAEIRQRTERIDELEERAAAVEDEIADLESAVESLRSDDYEGILEKHRRANRLEFEIGRLEGRRAEVADEIRSIEEQVDEAGDLAERRDEVADELAERRTRIERIEAAAVEEFNDRMATVLDRLDYGNLDRIWIERTECEVRDGRGTTTERAFDLHVVRSTDDGTTYEDTVDHLSESEREVTGLVFALAGFLVHEVYEAVPFVVLDSLEAIDAERIDALVEYFHDFADYLVVALLPEDAAALPDDYPRVTDI